MADVEVKSTHRKFYQVDGATVALLMEMFPEALEYIAQIPKAPPKPREDRWSVGTHAISGAPLLTHTTKSGEVRPYTGLPEQAEETFSRWGSSPPPLEVLDSYKRLHERHNAAPVHAGVKK